MALIREVLETLGHGAWLEEVGYCGGVLGGGVDYSRILPASLLRVYCDETAVFCHASLH